MSKYEIAEKIRKATDWTDVISEIEELVDLAGLKEEYNKADGENFEAIIEQAAEILEVEIY